MAFTPDRRGRRVRSGARACASVVLAAWLVPLAVPAPASVGLQKAPMEAGAGGTTLAWKQSVIRDE